MLPTVGHKGMCCCCSLVLAVSTNFPAILVGHTGSRVKCCRFLVVSTKGSLRLMLGSHSCICRAHAVQFVVILQGMVHMLSV